MTDLCCCSIDAAEDEAMASVNNNLASMAKLARSSNLPLTPAPTPDEQARECSAAIAANLRTQHYSSLCS